MRIFIENEPYSVSLLKEAGLSEELYVTLQNGNNAQCPYVGYFFSKQSEQPAFILPKVFSSKSIAFGKYPVQDIINLDAENSKIKDNHLKTDLFELSVWLYRAIDRFSSENQKSSIISRREKTERVVSRKGNTGDTLIDIVLSLLAFYKDHQNLLTYLTIINHSGNDKIHWQKTISHEQAIFVEKQPFYLEFLNKRKAVNFDEQLLILFFSVLNYLKETFHFNVVPPFRYELIQPRTIKSMIEKGKGTRILKSIRKKYFQDEFIQLWNLLYAFFEKKELISSGKSKDEALLAKDFNIIFEAMIDDLLNDSDIPEGLKDQEDGKVVDHIYKDFSILGEGLIFFIGDSKYYDEDNVIGTKSVYKQYTYAKNVIQECINLENNGKMQELSLRYRDSLTEGYNITPNFFIRGHYSTKSDRFNYSEPDLILSIFKEEKDRSCHFPNRLFDRDTLLLLTYSINILFVLASYSRGGISESEKLKLKKRIRHDISERVTSLYNLYKLSFAEESESACKAFVCKHFMDLAGKMYRLSESSTSIILGLDSKMDNETILSMLRRECYIEEIRQFNS